MKKKLITLKSLCVDMGYDFINWNYPHGNCDISGGDYNRFRGFLRDKPQREIIAYHKNCLGTIVSIKGIRKVFYFIILKPELWFGGFGYKLSRIDFKEFKRLTKGQKVIILNKTLYNKEKLKGVLEKI